MVKLIFCYLLVLEVWFMKYVEVVFSGCCVWCGIQSWGGKCLFFGFYGSFYIDWEYNVVCAHVFLVFFDGKILLLCVFSGYNFDYHCEYGYGIFCFDCIKLVFEEVNWELCWICFFKKVDVCHESGLSSVLG